MFVSRVLLFAASALLTPAGVYAQVVGGNISGRVMDPSGAVVPKAVVHVHSDDTGAQRTLTTSGEGAFAAPAIAIGRYTISVDAPGFAHYTRTGVSVTVGQTVELSLSLAVSGSDKIDVEDTPQAVNTSTEQTSGLVNSRQVKELPLNGRSYDQLMTLNPGTVNYTSQRSGAWGRRTLLWEACFRSRGGGRRTICFC